jgi:hypothetical protein
MLAPIVIHKTTAARTGWFTMSNTELFLPANLNVQLRSNTNTWADFWHVVQDAYFNICAILGVYECQLAVTRSVRISP